MNEQEKKLFQCSAEKTVSKKSRIMNDMRNYNIVLISTKSRQVYLQYGVNTYQYVGRNVIIQCSVNQQYQYREQVDMCNYNVLSMCYSGQLLFSYNVVPITWSTYSVASICKQVGKRVYIVKVQEYLGMFNVSQVMSSAF